MSRSNYYTEYYWHQNISHFVHHFIVENWTKFRELARYYDNETRYIMQLAAALFHPERDTNVADKKFRILFHDRYRCDTVVRNIGCTHKHGEEFASDKLHYN